MRRTVAALCVVWLVSGSAGAVGQEPSAEVGVRCALIGFLAEEVMVTRQSGAIMSDVMAAMGANNSLRDVAVSMVKEAYGVPQYRTEENQRQAITEFRNDVELACYTSGD